MMDLGLNHLAYQPDAAGRLCPLGTHIPRANPRKANLHEGTTGLLLRLPRTLGFARNGPQGDLIASACFHRLQRRGREYGTFLSPQSGKRQACGPGFPLSRGNENVDGGATFTVAPARPLPASGLDQNVL